VVKLSYDPPYSRIVNECDPYEKLCKTLPISTPRKLVLGIISRHVEFYFILKIFSKKKYFLKNKIKNLLKCSGISYLF
jgi:hypothetical protein